MHLWVSTRTRSCLESRAIAPVGQTCAQGAGSQCRQRLGTESPEELSPAELLTRYLESKETSPERTQILLQHAKEIFESTLSADVV